MYMGFSVSGAVLLAGDCVSYFDFLTSLNNTSCEPRTAQHFIYVCVCVCNLYIHVNYSPSKSFYTMYILKVL